MGTLNCDELGILIPDHLNIRLQYFWYSDVCIEIPTVLELVLITGLNFKYCLNWL
jgi:hypothetical protein